MQTNHEHGELTYEPLADRRLETELVAVLEAFRRRTELRVIE